MMEKAAFSDIGYLMQILSRDSNIQLLYYGTQQKETLSFSFDISFFNSNFAKIILTECKIEVLHNIFHISFVFTRIPI